VTYEECAAEGERISQSFPEGKRAIVQAVITAMSQHFAKLAINVRCPECDGLISIHQPVHNWWKVSCPCGACVDTMKGL
jgi:hypothetical protein